MILLREVVGEVPVRLHLVEQLSSVQADLRLAVVHRSIVTTCVIGVVDEAQLFKPADLHDLLLLDRAHLLGARYLLDCRSRLRLSDGLATLADSSAGRATALIPLDVLNRVQSVRCVGGFHPFGLLHLLPHGPAAEPFRIVIDAGPFVPGLDGLDVGFEQRFQRHGLASLAHNAGLANCHLAEHCGGLAICGCRREFAIGDP